MQFSSNSTSNPILNLIEALNAPAAICDLAGILVSHNTGFAALVSQAGSVLVGRPLAEFWDASQHQTLCTYLAGLRRDDPSLQSLSSGRLSIQPVSSPDGEVLLVQGTSANQEDPLLQFFLSHVDQGFWEIDMRNQLFSASDAWRRMRGHDLADDVNNPDQDWLDFVHPDDVQDLKEKLAAQVSGEASAINIQYRHRHLKTNEWIWLLCRATSVEYDENGAPARIVGTDTDITEIKQNEEVLEQLNRKIQLSIEVSGIGIWEFDSSTSRVYWDDRLLEIYGVEDGQNARSGDFWGERLHPDDREKTLAVAEECARTKSDLIQDFRIVRPSGEVRHVRTMARYADLSKTQTKLFGVNIDVTADVLHAQELERARKQLEYDSRHDALTGLANRRLLDERLASFLEGADHDHEICVMHMDLDHFKGINDTLGHAAGDAVLVHVAHTLRQIIGDAGLICRFGGDEFAVLLENPPPNEALEDLAGQIIAAFGVPLIYEGHACSFGVSIGAARGQGPGALGSNIFTKADIALYAAKNAGRSCFRVYSERTYARTNAHLRRRQDVLDAIARNGIECWYQPQFDAKTMQMIGAEALVRLHHPELGILGPQDFLPLVKETGLLSRVESKIFQCVLRDQTRWAGAGLSFPRVSVNVSPDRLMGTSMIDQVVQEVKDHHAITFELLETAFLDDPDDKILSNLDQLRSFGIPIELDDFGSGHASILAMSEILPDAVKIDQRLTKDITWSAEAMTILRALVTIARTKKLRVVMEGIETDDHFTAIMTVDCDVLQGFALCRPQNAKDFTAMLQAKHQVAVGIP